MMCAGDDDAQILKLTTHIISVQLFRYFFFPPEVPIWDRSFPAEGKKHSHNIISIVKPDQMYQCIKFILFCNYSTCFGRSFLPSSGVREYTYNNRHLSNR